LRFYFSLEKYATQGLLSFDNAVNDLTFKEINVSYDHSAFSMGIFKEKVLSKRFKIRGAGGINYSNLQFVNTQVNIPNKTSFNAINSIGLRFGAAFDYRLVEGISIVGKAHANFGLFNTIDQNGEYISKVSNIKNSDYPLLNISAGLRFNF
jgi:hypothetical protein